jgi:hypothetical protein
MSHHFDPVALCLFVVCTRDDALRSATTRLLVAHLRHAASAAKA